MGEAADSTATGGELKGPAPAAAPVLDYALGRSRRGRGFLAAAAGWAVPGMGHLIAGQRKLAADWFGDVVVLNVVALAALCYPATLLVGLVLLPVVSIAFLVMVVSSYRAGHRSQGVMLGHPAARYCVGVALLVAAYALSPGRALTAFIRRHYVQTFHYNNQSMIPTIAAGDDVIVYKQVVPRRWSVVAMITPDGYPTIRRVVGLPGETVEVRGTQLMINGQAMATPAGLGPYYAIRPGNIGFDGNVITLGQDEYYVLGDNTAIAGDSRFYRVGVGSHQPGAIPADHVIGVARCVYWPRGHWRWLDDKE